MTKSNSSQRKAAAPRLRSAPLVPVAWSLPSGLSLAEFGLRFGFLAPSLLAQSVVDGSRRNRSVVAVFGR